VRRLWIIKSSFHENPVLQAFIPPHPLIQPCQNLLLTLFFIKPLSIITFWVGIVASDALLILTNPFLYKLVCPRSPYIMDSSKTETDLQDLFSSWSSTAPCQNAKVIFTVSNTSYTVGTTYAVPSSDWTLDASGTTGVSIAQTTSAKRLFDLSLGTNFTATSLIFKDGSTPGTLSDRSGGFLTSSAGSIVTLTDCVVQNCASSFGGALYLPPNSATILRNTTFQGNTGYEGGSIYANNAVLEMTDCAFRYSTTPDTFARGGAMYVTGSVATTITRCSFMQCSANYAGGALYLTSSPGQPIVLRDSLFTNNSAGSIGGAILALSVPLRVNSSIFTQNYQDTITRNDMWLQNTDLVCSSTCATTFPANQCVETCPTAGT